MPRLASLFPGLLMNGIVATYLNTTNIEKSLRTALATRAGPVPDSLPHALRRTPTYSIATDSFILRLPSGLKYYYRVGASVVVDKPAGTPQSDVDLFLNATVYGAICYLNGLVPLHASAVVHEGQVFAFSAGNGGGKSTLAAGLAKMGFTVFADDVIPLALDRDGQPIAFPGSRRMKLWSDACSLTGHPRGDRVRDGIDKYYVETGSLGLRPAPLRSLFMLANQPGELPALTCVSGADRVAAFNGALYRPAFCAALVDNRQYFDTSNRMSSAISLIRFERRMRKDEFKRGLELIADALRSGNDIAN